MAGITNREVKVKNVDEEIKYEPALFNLEYADIYCNTDELESIDRARYIKVLIAAFEREVNDAHLKQSLVKNVFDQCLEDIDEVLSGGADDAFTINDQIDLIHLATLSLTELDDLPPLMYLEYTEKVLKWLARFGPSEIFGKLDKQAGSNHHIAEKICSCIAVVEASFRPVPEAMSIYGKLSKIIDRTSDADARGCLIRLAASTVCTEEECESVAQLIQAAIDSPSEDLIIHGIRAAAIFLDRFGDDAGLDGDVLEKDIPNAGQRECGVSKANIDRACRDIFEFVRAPEGEEKVPGVKITDDIDYVVEGFAKQETLQCAQRVYGGSLVLNFQRTRNGIFRISQKALGYNKGHRDRALGVSKSMESLSRERARRDQAKERAAARDHRRQLDEQQFE